MKKQIWRFFLALVGLFLIMFTVQFVYLATKSSNYSYRDAGDLLNNFSGGLRLSNNIASKKYKSNSGAGQQTVSVDQKYEKTANMTCRTTSFSEDEKMIRQTIKEENALIQFEQKSGTDNNRQLFLQVGVPPDRFDAFVEKIKAAQKIVKFDVSKKDKTNEYRELNSQREALQNTRAALIELKSKGGKIDEYISLENRILDIDSQLQQLGVQLGSFDSENEFCTVNISLQEGKEYKRSWSSILKGAFEWSIKYYLFLMTAIAFALLSASALVWIIEKLKVFQKGENS